MPITVISFDKLTVECRKCKRLIYNGGTCGGRSGLLNICLVYLPLESLINKKIEGGMDDEEKTYKIWKQI